MLNVSLTLQISRLQVVLHQRKNFKNLTEKTVKEQVKEGELKLITFLAEHNLPFSLIDHLPKMVAAVCPDSKIADKMKNNYKRKKTTQLTTAVLGPPCKEMRLQT
ncbi:hypothetical protein ILUMI_18088 [Ignelater luminosus]|uniref:Uncharacterized protein n=1 Tax=Ignelater luminosus TaxID=2038154 RepID=A0A8K0CQX9_IGNLU|nr:hypothetical protein ILUMI_18088 [Ignelater luminosus]